MLYDIKSNYLLFSLNWSVHRMRECNSIQHFHSLDFCVHINATLIFFLDRNIGAGEPIYVYIKIMLSNIESFWERIGKNVVIERM